MPIKRLQGRVATDSNIQGTRLSCYTKVCSGLIFPIHEFLKGHHSVALRRSLEASQWLTPAELQRGQLPRLRDFLVAAGSNVPYYRDSFREAGFRPQTVTSLADLQILPRLTKALIRENIERLKSSVAGRLIRCSTGGSSGEPLVFYMGLDRITHDVAAKWRATRWWGVDIGDPEIALWGSPVELSSQDRIKVWRDKLLRSRLLPAFQMSESQIDRYIETIQRVRPRMIFGYASAVALLAKRAVATGQSISNVGVKVVFLTGETLYPDQREVVERAFGAIAANGYGSRDAGFIAHQCPHGALHISAEHIIVELLDESGRPVARGQQGEIVTTHLATKDFPFIRYRTGDMAILSETPCTCGRGLPVFQEVLGRTTDFIRTPSGNTMHALALIYEVRERPGVVAFKFIQSENLSLELQLVVNAGYSQIIEDQIRRGLLARLGPGANLLIRQVREIPPEKSGKYRYVVSRAPC